MKLTAAAVFVVGYVVGAKAGHDRYAQIADGMARASRRLDEFSARRPPAGQGPGSPRADGDT